MARSLSFFSAGPALAALACIALSLSPTASAAAPAVTLLEDPAGDVQMGDTGQSAPGPAFATLDMLALAISEDDDAFHFTLTMQEATTGSDSRSDGEGAYIQFVHNGREFLLFLGHLYLPVVEYFPASLAYRDSDTAAWNTLWFRDPGMTVDPAARTMSVSVPRDDLVDAMGAAPYKGRSLTSFHAVSIELVDYLDVCCPLGTYVDTPRAVHDNMPDTGIAAVAYAVQVGPEQMGHAFLTSPEPFRASNGEATTFLYKAYGQNTGASADRFTLRTLNVPADWGVSLPTPVLELAAGETKEFPVIVTVPFTHVHGATKAFRVEMASDSDPRTVGRLDMGIRYLAIPQPAGHHATVYFHANLWDSFSGTMDPVLGGNSGYATMNGLELDPDEADVAISPQGYEVDTSVTPPVDDYSWCIRLNPTLQLGLDFIPGETAHLALPIRASAPLQGASLTGRLVLQPATSPFHGPYACYNEQNNVPLATLDATVPKDIAASSDAVLEGAFAVLPAADIVPYVRGQDLLLEVHLRAVSTPNPFMGAVAPTLKPGGALTLPLLEYHDPVTDILDVAAGPNLDILGPQERRANPGSTVVFQVALANDADAGRTMVLNVTGTNAAWVQVPATVAVPALDTAKAQIVVRVPAEAAQGDAADLVLQAYDQADPAARTLLRLLVVAETGAPIPDDAELVEAEAEKGSPSPAAAAVAALALAAAGLRSRRR